KTPDCTDICSNNDTPVTFTYVARNTGNFFPITNGSVVDDNGTPGDPSDDVTVGTWSSLGVGASLTFTHTFTLNNTRTNTATARGRSGPVCQGPGGNIVSTTASATVTAHTCAISLTKTPDCTDICTGSNTPVTFTYVARNTGNFFPI